MSLVRAKLADAFYVDYIPFQSIAAHSSRSTVGKADFFLDSVCLVLGLGPGELKEHARKPDMVFGDVVFLCTRACGGSLAAGVYGRIRSLYE